MNQKDVYIKAIVSCEDESGKDKLTKGQKYKFTQKFFLGALKVIDNSGEENIYTETYFDPNDLKIAYTQDQI